MIRHGKNIKLINYENKYNIVTNNKIVSSNLK